MRNAELCGIANRTVPVRLRLYTGVPDLLDPRPPGWLGNDGRSGSVGAGDHADVWAGRVTPHRRSRLPNPLRTRTLTAQES